MKNRYPINKTFAIILMCTCMIFIIYVDIKLINNIEDSIIGVIFLTIFGGWAIIAMIMNFKRIITGEYVLNADRISISQCSEITRNIEFKNITSIKYINLILYEHIQINEINNDLPLLIDNSTKGYMEIWQHVTENCKKYEHIKISKRLLDKLEKIKKV